MIEEGEELLLQEQNGGRVSGGVDDGIVLMGKEGMMA